MEPSTRHILLSPVLGLEGVWSVGEVSTVIEHLELWVS